jgi:hypothetical protein
VLDELRAYHTQRRGGWVEVELTGELSLVALVDAIWCTRPLKPQFQANRRSHEAPRPQQHGDAAEANGHRRRRARASEQHKSGYDWTVLDTSERARVAASGVLLGRASTTGGEGSEVSKRVWGAAPATPARGQRVAIMLCDARLCIIYFRPDHPTEMRQIN